MTNIQSKKKLTLSLFENQTLKTKCEDSYDEELRILDGIGPLAKYVRSNDLKEIQSMNNESYKIIRETFAIVSNQIEKITSICEKRLKFHKLLRKKLIEHKPEYDEVGEAHESQIKKITSDTILCLFDLVKSDENLLTYLKSFKVIEKCCTEAEIVEKNWKFMEKTISAFKKQDVRVKKAGKAGSKERKLKLYRSSVKDHIPVQFHRIIVIKMTKNRKVPDVDDDTIISFFNRNENCICVYLPMEGQNQGGSENRKAQLLENYDLRMKFHETERNLGHPIEIEKIYNQHNELSGSLLIPYKPINEQAVELQNEQKRKKYELMVKYKSGPQNTNIWREMKSCKSDYADKKEMLPNDKFNFVKIDANNLNLPITLVDIIRNIKDEKTINATSDKEQTFESSYNPINNVNVPSNAFKNNINLKLRVEDQTDKAYNELQSNENFKKLNKDIKPPGDIFYLGAENQNFKGSNQLNKPLRVNLSIPKNENASTNSSKDFCKVLSSQDDENNWNLIEPNKIKKVNQKEGYVSFDVAGNSDGNLDNKKYIGMPVESKDISEDNLKMFAQKIDEQLNSHEIGIAILQKENQFIVLVTVTNGLDEAAQKFKGMGDVIYAGHNLKHRLYERQKVRIELLGNITTYDNQTLKIYFNSKMSNTNEFKVKIKDYKEDRENDSIRGKIKFKITPRTGREVELHSSDISIPKTAIVKQIQQLYLEIEEIESKEILSEDITKEIAKSLQTIPEGAVNKLYEELGIKTQNRRTSVTSDKNEENVFFTDLMKWKSTPPYETKIQAMIKGLRVLNEKDKMNKLEKSALDKAEILKNKKDRIKLLLEDKD